MASPEKQYRLSRRGDVPALTEVTGLGRSTIYKLISEKKFPEGIALSPRCRVWPESQILEWQRANGLTA